MNPIDPSLDLVSQILEDPQHQGPGPGFYCGNLYDYMVYHGARRQLRKMGWETSAEYQKNFYWRITARKLGWVERVRQWVDGVR